MRAAIRHRLERTRLLQRAFRVRAEDVLPMTVEHRRIYILPTRRGWAFLLALLLMLIGSINYSLSLGYALSFLLTGLFAATLLHTYRNLAGMRIESISADKAFSGERLPFRLRLSNTSGSTRHGLCIRAVVPDELQAVARRVDVRAAIVEDSHLDVEIALPTIRRGEQALGRLTLWSDWPLGLWRTWSYLHAPVSGLVFPRPETAPPPLPTRSVGAEGKASLAAQQGDFAGLRSYVPGDPLSRIAWKSVARGQGLHVRQFDDAAGLQSAFLSLPETRLSDLDAQLSRLVAWVLAAESAQVDYAFELPGDRLPATRGNEQRMAALTACALYGQNP